MYHQSYHNATEIPFHEVYTRDRLTITLWTYCICCTW